jgi:hypothetical protein
VEAIAAKDEVIRALTAERDAAILLAQRMHAANATEPADSQASLEQVAEAKPEVPPPELARRVLAEAEALETVSVTGGGTTACASQPCLLDGACKNDGACVAGEGASFRCECVGVFFGDRCEEEPPCAEGVCLNGGVCSDYTTDKSIAKPEAGGAGGFYCQCQAHGVVLDGLVPRALLVYVQTVRQNVMRPHRLHRQLTPLNVCTRPLLDGVDDAVLAVEVVVCMLPFS